MPDSNGKYLIEKHTISTTPSIEAFDLLYQRKTRTQKTSESLIVGNPTLPKTSFKSCNPTNLSPLPGAEQEAKHIAAILKTQALTRDKATETAVLAKISKAGIIHLATSICKDNDSSIIPLATSNQDDGWLTLMISFYENYSNHRGAGALRQAMLKTMKKYPNPRYWAAFTLIGT